MQLTNLRGGPEVAVPSQAPPAKLRRRDLMYLAALLGAAAAALIVTIGLSGPGRWLSHEDGSTIGLLLATGSSAVVLLWLSPKGGAWSGTRALAAGVCLFTTIESATATRRILDPTAGQQAGLSLAVGVVLVAVVAALVIDLGDHVVGQRSALLSDVTMVAVLTGGAAFVVLRETDPQVFSLAGSVLAAVAVVSVVVVAGRAVLALWCPTWVHVALLAFVAALGASSISLVRALELGGGSTLPATPQLALGLSLMAMTGTLVLEPVLNAGGARTPRMAWWTRPVILGLSISGAGALLLAGLLTPDAHVRVGEVVGLALAFIGTVGVRAMVNQVRLVRTTTQLERALEEKDEAITSLKEAAGLAATSEARLRLLLDSAVDGIVELDARGVIVRVNSAFCSMVRLPIRAVIGETWARMAANSGPSSASLAGLLETGEAQLASGNGTTYLEARSSTLPTTPPGRLLLIRDVSPSKAAEQTIRTLFQFLQDRDEDRTRLLQRTNAAIEAERNRIARDLHDGPIQGISGAAMSLQAIKLMVESGDAPSAAELLHIVSGELSDEALNLRQVMSDLRPPVLEERGLFPAVRELCAKSQRDLGVTVSVEFGALSDIPSDLETLAYRVIQEALSNVSKHAEATHVTVRIEASAGTLTVEISDNGRGFDSAEVRGFLRAGKVGLASMRERAELAGGTLMIRTAAGAGTIVTATLPYEILGAAPQAG